MRVGKKLNITTFIIANLIIYMPFHLFEEAIGDFPKWMYEHKWLPYHMNHGHWMANNIFIYYPLLLISIALYFFCGITSCGIAIIVWGVIDFCDHFFYTIKDKKISPGLFTGILFLINSVVGIVQYINSDAFSVLSLILAIIIGGILFGAPIGLCVVIYDFFDKYFK